MYKEGHGIPGRCKEGVWHQSGNWGRTYQCGKKATKDGYCGTHHPDAVAKRRVAGIARLDAERKEYDARVKKTHDDAKRLVLFPDVVTALQDLYDIQIDVVREQPFWINVKSLLEQVPK